MHAAPAIPSRPLPAQASVTIIKADLRTRQLAEAMVKLNAEGGCTEAALLREGFSRYELTQLADAARAVANQIFVRIDEPVQPTDDELIEASASRALQLVDATRIRAQMKGIQITDDTMARIWPKVCAKLARQVALLPLPGVPA